MMELFLVLSVVVFLYLFNDGINRCVASLRNIERLLAQIDANKRTEAKRDDDDIRKLDSLIDQPSNSTKEQHANMHHRTVLDGEVLFY